MYKTELDILEEQVREKRIEMLVEKGLIRPITSIEEYNSAIGEAKQKASHRLFTNSYMMRAEVERLINLNLLYQVPMDNGVGFVENQQSYWRLHLHVDLEKKLQLPKLEKSILIEFVYSEENMTDKQRRFKDALNSGYSAHFYETYREIAYYNKITKSQYDAYYRSIQNTLKREGSYICAPNDEQLVQFERIYRERIDLYTQSFYTMEERKQQRDRGLMRVLVDKDDEVIAISLDPLVGGGAIAVRPDCASNIYATAFFIDGLKDQYKDGVDISNEISATKGAGWIATRNVASRRVHELFGIKWTGRAFDQFIIPGYMC